MKRREFLVIAAGGAAAASQVQGLFRSTVPIIKMQITATSFTPAFTKTGAVLHWNWGDGTFTDSNNPTKSYPAGTKSLQVSSKDGFNGVTVASAQLNQFSAVPSFSLCSNMVTLTFNSSGAAGTLPPFSNNTKLVYFDVSTNSLSGTLPSFATCTKLIDFRAYNNSFSNVVPGSFATQKSLASLYCHANALSSAAVNQILADCVVSLGISGRVTCSVALYGGTNGAPTGQGILDKATLIAAGWTVTTT